MLPIQIYLKPPYLVVTPTASVYNISLPINSDLLTFGYIEEKNFNTLGYSVGDRILYPQSLTNPVIIIQNVQYSLLDENKIILTEPEQSPV